MKSIPCSELPAATSVCSCSQASLVTSNVEVLAFTTTGPQVCSQDRTRRLGSRRLLMHFMAWLCTLKHTY